MKHLLLSLFFISLSSASYAQSDRGISKLIAADLDMEEEQVFQILKSFKKHVVETLRNDDIVRLQGLGQFYPEHQDARPGNPRTGETEPVPAKKYLRFKASKVGNQSLN